MELTLLRKWSFSLSIFLVNVTKPTGNQIQSNLTFGIICFYSWYMKQFLNSEQHCWKIVPAHKRVSWLKVILIEGSWLMNNCASECRQHSREGKTRKDEVKTPIFSSRYISAFLELPWFSKILAVFWLKKRC